MAEGISFPASYAIKDRIASIALFSLGADSKSTSRSDTYEEPSSFYEFTDIWQMSISLDTVSLVKVRNSLTSPIYGALDRRKRREDGTLPNFP